jgi:PD-(D/E)XK nuclease superfamily
VETVHEPSAWRLSPSDLTFLWEECRRCFWLKVAGNLPRPRAPFPRVFGLLDGQTKEFFAAKRTEKISPGLPPGRVYCGDRWVRSRPLDVPGHRRKVLLRGRIDTALAFYDGTFGIVDFKTAEPKDGHVGLYGRQLHSYALAAENAAKGSLLLPRVSVLGLLCVEPVGVDGHDEGVAFYGEPQWVEVPRDDDAFLAFLLQVLLILDREVPPEPAPECQFCRYLAAGAVSLLTDLYGSP